MILHRDPRDEPNVGREHGPDLIPECGLCRCGAHNVEDDPTTCPECLATIERATSGAITDPATARRLMAEAAARDAGF